MELNHKIKPIDLISRFSWKTVFVKVPYLKFHIEKDFGETKIFIGKIDESNGSFFIRRLRKNLSTFLPQIYVKGFIKEDKIEFKFRPGLLTTLFYLFLIYGIGVVIWQIINSKNIHEAIADGIIWFSLYILGTIALTLWEIIKTTKIISDTLELTGLTPSNTVNS